jgi:thioredoxin-related protein
MRAIVTWPCLFCGLLTVMARADEQHLRWVRRVDEAQRLAAAERKDLFINFTGLEWCGHCIHLDTAVLSRREFRATATDFVLVDLDFPADRDQLGELKVSYDGWMKQYLVVSLPTIVLSDETGRPYAYFTGYDREVDVAKFMQQIAAARESRRTRDRELAVAKHASGAERARALHAAVQAVAARLGTIEERGDDPLMRFYRDEVEEICRLDAGNGLALREQYDARRRTRDEHRRGQAIIAELQRYKTKEGRRIVPQRLHISTICSTRSATESYVLSWSKGDAAFWSGARNTPTRSRLCANFRNLRIVRLMIATGCFAIRP